MIIKNLKKLFTMIVFSLYTGVALGAPDAKNTTSAKQSAPASKSSATHSSAPVVENELQYALNLAKKGDYLGASSRLFSMTRNPKYINDRMRIKYILGLMFFEMKMYQVSAFQFVDVVRNGDKRYTKQSLQKLSIAADILNDDTLINYAIGKIEVEEFPKENHDMLRYRIGEYYQRKGEWDKAVLSFSKVPPLSPFFPKAKYMEGLANVRRNDLNAALACYSSLADNRQPAGVTDIDRVAGLMGMARIYYQSHKWDQAIDIYRQIPRDTELWHDAHFESSWAHMRSAHFRSVLSNFHSLHSSFYEDFYLPESILLRGIVYLYICQYDEMEKALGLFERIYQPVLNRLEDFTKTTTDLTTYFTETERVIKNFNVLKADNNARRGYRVPFLVARDIIREGDFKHIYAYIVRLREEQAIVNSQPAIWRRSTVGQYANNLLKGRLDSSVKLVSGIVRTHMVTMKQNLSDMFEQYNFARYEMLNGKKEALKKKIQSKGVVTVHVDETKNRSFYIQNGYEYWPFRGEYWLDEIGDYHYLGTQGCE